MIRFDELSLGDFFLVAGEVYEKVDDSWSKHVSSARIDRTFGQDFPGYTMVERLEIVVSFEHPPIPLRTHDYRATLKDGDEETGPQGWGVSRRIAIIDLASNIEDHEASK